MNRSTKREQHAREQSRIRLHDAANKCINASRGLGMFSDEAIILKNDEAEFRATERILREV